MIEPLIIRHRKWLGINFAHRRKSSAKDLASRILTRVFRNLSERQMLLSVFLSRVHRRYSSIKKRQETWANGLIDCSSVEVLLCWGFDWAYNKRSSWSICCKNDVYFKYNLNRNSKNIGFSLVLHVDRSRLIIC